MSLSIEAIKTILDIQEDIILSEKEMETRKDSIVFLCLIYFLSFWALLKYLFWHYLLGIDREKIRNKFCGSLWIDFFSKTARNIRINATNWRALDEIYNYHERIERYNNIEKWINKYWMKMENAQALRNRAKMVKKFLIKEIKKKLKISNGKIKIFSIACGSAQPLLEAINEFNPEEQERIELTLLDKDKNALDYSKILAEKLNYKGKIAVINKTTTYLIKLFNKHTFDIIEMVGFLDYRPKNDAIDLIKRLKNILNKNGVFFTANICPNKEKFFLDWVLLWPMIYRSEKQFKEILFDSDFKKDNIKIIFEPLKIHQLAVCYNK